MNQINNPHDVFFKETMVYVDIAKDFLQHYLPQEILELIDLDTLRLAKDCYTNKDLESFFSDLLYEVHLNQRETFIYVLFEHKSSPYFYTAFKVLEYMVRIWDIFIKQQKGKTRVKLPLIIPIVYYHGQQKWNVGLDLASIVESIPVELEDFIPNFKMILKDFSPTGSEEIMGQAFLKIFLYLTIHIFDESIMDILRLIFTLFQESHDEAMKSAFLITVLRYIMSNRSDIMREDLQEVTSNLLPERSDVIMTLAEQLINEGKREGKREGNKEGLLDSIESFIIIKYRLDVEGLPDDISTKLKEKKLSELKRIRNDLYDGYFSSFDHVREYLSK